jgi:hypothetical protein
VLVPFPGLCTLPSGFTQGLVLSGAVFAGEVVGAVGVPGACALDGFGVEVVGAEVDGFGVVDGSAPPPLFKPVQGGRLPDPLAPGVVALVPLCGALFCVGVPVPAGGVAVPAGGVAVLAGGMAVPEFGWVVPFAFPELCGGIPGCPVPFGFVDVAGDCGLDPVELPPVDPDVCATAKLVMASAPIININILDFRTKYFMSSPRS